MEAKILLIDPDFYLGNQLRHYLSLSNLELEVVDNAVLGFVRLQQKKYDLVLLELDLPFQNGLAALPRFKSLYPKLPVLIYTNSEFYKKSEISWMAEAYLKKEEDLRPVLLEVIRHLHPAEVPPVAQVPKPSKGDGTGTGFLA